VNTESTNAAWSSARSTLKGPGAASLFCPFFETEDWKIKQIGPLPKEYGGVAWSRSPAE
jgi:hypothetical protein